MQGCHNSRYDSAVLPLHLPMSIQEQNQFYTDWDQETRGTRGAVPGEYRNPFEIDRDRIIHSTAFRRLQGKTQVYVTGQSDRYRTRLTHSIEVAQIGRSLVNLLNRITPELGPDFHIDAALVEAACLAHDLGNPPIGHRGESMLNNLMDPFGGFEGNAQSLRILTKTLRGDHRGTDAGGMHATRACLDAILKYKVVGKQNTPQQAKFLYEDQHPIRTWVHGNPAIEERAQAGERIRSLECNIMDLADDIAYTTSDLYDGYKQELVREQPVQHFREKSGDAVDEEVWLNFLAAVRGERSMSRFGAFLIGRWVRAATLRVRKNELLSTNRYRFDLQFPTLAVAELR